MQTKALKTKRLKDLGSTTAKSRNPFIYNGSVEWTCHLPFIVLLYRLYRRFSQGLYYFVLLPGTSRRERYGQVSHRVPPQEPMRHILEGPVEGADADGSDGSWTDLQKDQKGSET